VQVQHQWFPAGTVRHLTIARVLLSQQEDKSMATFATNTVQSAVAQ
jgi:hypothetical protein